MGIDANLPVVGPGPPDVLVFPPVVHQEQHPAGGEALHHAVEKCLGLGIDPMQILEYRQERLDLALSQENSLDPVERLLATLGGVESLPERVVDRNIEEPEQRREEGFECSVQREEPARHLLADLARFIARLDLEIAPKELDEREKRRCLPVRD